MGEEADIGDAEKVLPCFHVPLDLVIGIQAMPRDILVDRTVGRMPLEGNRFKGLDFRRIQFLAGKVEDYERRNHQNRYPTTAWAAKVIAPPFRSSGASLTILPASSWKNRLLA